MKKMKIVNVKKFVRSIVITALIIIASILFFPKATLSHNESKNQNYETISVSQGDTLWTIATMQQQNNPYYTDKDVRFVISELRRINNLYSCELQISQTLNVPVL